MKVDETLLKETLFRPLREIAPERRLKVGVYGKAEVGKTHFALTFPAPVYVIDTEFGVVPLSKKFADKDIRVFECFVVDEKNKKGNPVLSLMQVENAVKELANVSEGTIVIDSISDVWTWEEMRMREIVEQTGRQVYQFDWGIANRHYLELIRQLLSYPVNLVLTAKARDVYGSEGQRLEGLIEPRWQRDTEYLMDVVIRLDKRTMAQPNVGLITRYVGTIEKCRAERQFNKEIQDLTYDKLVLALKDVLWWL